MGQKKKVKLEDIAEKLGVSIVTVSNALKGKKGVSEEMREKITQLPEENSSMVRLWQLIWDLSL